MYAGRHWGWRRLELIGLLVAALSAVLLLASSSAVAVTLGPVLYDQNNSFDSGILSRVDVGTGSADDFVVPGSTSWHIGAVFAAGSDDGGLTSVTVTIYNDSSGSPGAQVYTTTVASPLFGDAADPNWPYHPGGDLTIPVDVTLTSGHYWLEVQGGGADWYSNTRNVVSNGNAAMWLDSRGYYGSCTTWTDLATCQGWTPDSYDLMFTLYQSANDDLTPTNGADLYVNEGAAFSGRTLGTFTDVNTSTLATAFSASVNWGDGTATSSGTVTGSNGNFTVTGSHTYSEEGDYSVVTSVSGGTGGSAEIDTTVHVADAALTIGNPKLAFKAARGSTTSTATLTVKFTDANRYATAADFTSTIQWGDGNSVTPTFTAAGGKSWAAAPLTHTYTRGTSYTITITINDEGGQTASIQKTFTVR